MNPLCKKRSRAGRRVAGAAVAGLAILLATGCQHTETQPATDGETAMPADPNPGPVPAELLDKIRKDAAQRAGAESGEATIIRAEALVFNDGSLGCPEPDTMYTQAQVEGYWVVLELAGQSYDYRATRRGYFRLCNNAKPPRRDSQL